jgi:hypothetical protein
MEELFIQMQQSKQAQEAEYQRRRGIVRVALILLVILILLRILGIARPVPAVIAGNGNEPVRASGPAAALRVEWLGYCDQTKVGLAAYGANDIPCSPSRVVSLPSLQEQLTSAGVVEKGEYLTLSASASPACRAAVVNGENGQITGWLCLEANGRGLYRADAAGQNPGPVWQFWSDGEWQLPQA